MNAISEYYGDFLARNVSFDFSRLSRNLTKSPRRESGRAKLR